MDSCSMCGSAIPEGQGVCSMCYGDPYFGADGYYLAELQREEEYDRQSHTYEELISQEPDEGEDDDLPF